MTRMQDRSVPGRGPRLGAARTAAIVLLGLGGVAAHAVSADIPGGAATKDLEREGESAPPPEHASGPLVHVDIHAPAGGDGTSWQRAFRNLQDALDYARSNSVDQILVAEGTYRPDVGGGETARDRSATFRLVNRVELLGGFAGYGAGNPYQRDIEQFETVLSGDLAGNDLPGRVNNGENSYSVVTAESVGSTAQINGFTIRGGNANGPDPGPLENIRGGGMWVLNASPRVIECSFVDNESAFHGGAMYNRNGSQSSIENCRFSSNYAGLRGGAVFNAFDSNSVISNCEFRDNASGENGGAINSHDSNLEIVDCGFFDNVSGEGGAIHAGLASTLDVARSEFARNVATVDGGAIRVVDDCALVVSDSRFHEGEAIDGGALFVDETAPAATVRGALFVRNAVIGLGGAVFDASGSTFVNCAFSRNSATATGGGAAYLIDASTFINCTLSRNSGGGLRSTTLGPTLVNSVVWANSPDQIRDDGAAALVMSSDIQGGWAGPGSDNMNAEPCFVQSTEDNIRLATGSPCLNRGDNSAIPAGVTTDLDGNPRVVAGIVDLGAYEGERDAVPLIAEDLDVDDNERSVLVPSGEAFDPLEFPAVSFINRSGTDNATVRVSESYKVLHPEAGGFSELGPIMQVETSLPDGDMFATIYVSFVAEALPGVDPLDIDLTYYDEATGNWALAVSRNRGNSPGHAGVIGDRTTVVGEVGAFTSDLGDYGVFLHSVSHHGIIWANVDHAAEFAIGVPLCPADAAQPPDGRIGMADMLAVLKGWALGADAGPYDINGDERVDGLDIAEIFGAWGACQR